MFREIQCVSWSAHGVFTDAQASFFSAMIFLCSYSDHGDSLKHSLILVKFFLGLCSYLNMILSL